MRLPLSLPLLTGAPLLAAFAASWFFRGTDTIWFAPAIVLFLLWGVAVLAPGWRQGWTLPRSATFYLVTTFWLYLWLALLWSTAPFISTLFTIIFSVLPAGLIFLALAPDRLQQARIAAATIGVGLAALAVWALIQYFFLFDQYGPRIRHPLLNPNSLGGILNLGLLPAIALFVAARSRGKAFLYGLAVMLFFMALIVTRSRGAMIGGGIGVIVLLPFLLYPVLKLRLSRAAQLAGIFVFALVIFYAHTAISGIAHPVQAVVSDKLGASLLDRGSLWYSTWQMFMDHFWLGTGFSTFSYWYPAYRLPQDVSDGYFAHMDPLQFGAEIGVLGYLLFYAVLIAVLGRTVRALNAAVPDSQERVAVIGSFAAMLALVLHTHISFHLYILAALIPLGVVLGYWYVVTSSILNDKTLVIKSNRNGRVLVIGLLILVLVLPVQWTTRAALATHYAGENQSHLYDGNFKAVKDTLSKAHLVSPASFHTVHSDEARWRIKKISEEGRRLNDQEKMELFSEALLHIDKAIKLNKGLVSLKSTKAQLLYLANGDIIPDGTEQAAKLLREVIERDPLYLDGRMGLAKIYQQKGEFGKALAVLEEGLRWPRVKGQADINFLVRVARLRLLTGDKVGHDQMIKYAGQRAKAYGLTRQTEN